MWDWRNNQDRVTSSSSKSTLRREVMRGLASIFSLGSALVVASTASAFAIDSSSQPLTRADCNKAAMRWNEGANVCVPNAEGSKAEGSKAQTAPKAEAASKEKNASKPKAALHAYKKKGEYAASKTKKFHARHAHYAHPQHYQPIERRPFRWLFRNPNRPAGASYYRHCWWRHGYRHCGLGYRY
jgi:hypothetical protein